jgi:hypothetical protein
MDDFCMPGCRFSGVPILNVNITYAYCSTYDLDHRLSRTPRITLYVSRSQDGAGLDFEPACFRLVECECSDSPAFRLDLPLQLQQSLDHGK